MGRIENLPVKTQQMNMLHDFYGELLTAKQNDYFMLHFMDDLSLAEIAAQYGVTPQAAADNIKRACAMLIRFESKLGLMQKHAIQADAASRLRMIFARVETDRGILDEINSLLNEMIH